MPNEKTLSDRFHQSGLFLQKTRLHPQGGAARQKQVPIKIPTKEKYTEAEKMGTKKKEKST